MVCELGMSEDLGPLAWGEKEGGEFLGRMTRVQTYSEQTAQRIDTEVRRIVTKSHEIARQILVLNVHVLHKVAQTLIERETLDKEEFNALVAEAGPVPIQGVEGMRWLGV